MALLWQKEEALIAEKASFSSLHETLLLPWLFSSWAGIVGFSLPEWQDRTWRIAVSIHFWVRCNKMFPLILRIRASMWPCRKQGDGPKLAWNILIIHYTQDWELHPYVMWNLKNWKQNLALSALLFDLAEILLNSNNIFGSTEGPLWLASEGFCWLSVPWFKKMNLEQLRISKVILVHSVVPFTNLWSSRFGLFAATEKTFRASTLQLWETLFSFLAF